jgi:hypothetical protein
MEMFVLKLKNNNIRKNPPKKSHLKHQKNIQDNVFLVSIGHDLKE